MEALTFPPDEAKELAEHFGALVSKVPLRTIDDEKHYDEAVRVLDALLDSGGANDDHDLAPRRCCTRRIHWRLRRYQSSF